jgi:hypothetical protein
MSSAAGFVIPLKEKFVMRKDHKAGEREINKTEQSLIMFTPERGEADVETPG